MISSDFVDRISSTKGVRRKDMIEKDIILHQILLDLSRENFFSKNFLFKGGTCLIKHYLGYFRFSEDIDFTWKDQTRFDGKSSRQINEDLSGIIDETGKILEKIASKRGLDFKCDKANRDYVELNSRGRICTFKIWYDSAILKKRAFLKIQINFLDELCLKPQNGDLKSLMTERSQELEALFAEYSEYASTIPFLMYDVKEILSEKIRALLTRRAIKARDFLDIFFISKNIGAKPEDVEECTITKISYALEHYERFRENLDDKKMLLDKGSIFEWGAERDLLLAEIDETEFNRFVDEFTKYLRDLVKKLGS